MGPDEDANLWFSGLLHFYCDNVNLSERNELDDAAGPETYTYIAGELYKDTHIELSYYLHSDDVQDADNDWC